MNGADSDRDSAPSRTPREAPAEVQVGVVHYQILCAAGLVLVFLAQLDQGMLLGNLLVVVIGLLGIVSGMSLAPLLTFIVLLIAQTGNHLLLYRTFEIEQQRPLFHLADVLLTIGMLAYVAGHYRLQGLWKQLLPVDVRERRRVEAGAGAAGRYEQALLPRGARLLTPAEIVRFLIVLPAAALAGQLAWLVLGRGWLPEVYPERLMRLIGLGWGLVIGGLVAGAVLGMWRRRQMGPEAARMLLQDTLWQETRREQRRIFRWLTWRKARRIDQTT
jgi:hypothetical protein